MRAIPAEVKQQLEQAVEQQITECSELTEGGQFACPEFAEVNPAKSQTGEAPPKSFDLETMSPESAEAICAEPVDELRPESIVRQVHCEWSFTVQETHYAATQTTVSAPASITCYGYTGWCDWGNGVRVYVEYIYNDCHFFAQPLAEKDGLENGCLDSFNVNCSEGAPYYGYVRSYAGCLPQEISVRGKEIAAVSTRNSVEGLIEVKAQLTAKGNGPHPDVERKIVLNPSV